MGNQLASPRDDAHEVGRLRHRIKVLEKKLKVAEAPNDVLTFSLLQQSIYDAVRSIAKEHPSWDMAHPSLPTSIAKRFMGQVVARIDNANRIARGERLAGPQDPSIQETSLESKIPIDETPSP